VIRTVFDTFGMKPAVLPLAFAFGTLL